MGTVHPSEHLRNATGVNGSSNTKIYAYFEKVVTSPKFYLTGNINNEYIESVNGSTTDVPTALPETNNGWWETQFEAFKVDNTESGSKYSIEIKTKSLEAMSPWNHTNVNIGVMDTAQRGFNIGGAYFNKYGDDYVMAESGISDSDNAYLVNKESGGSIVLRPDTYYKICIDQSSTFDSSNPLISSRKNVTNGYVALNDRYSQLVMHVRKVTSTNSMTAGRPTIYYVNAQGSVKNHEYDRLDLSQGENFDIVFDLSPKTLTDGCIGLLSLTCDNSQSHLTITFGDVYFSNDYSATLSGAFVADDSNVMDFTTDPACVSLDMTAVTDLPASLPWLSGNRVAYVADGTSVSTPNVVAGEACNLLTLSEEGGDFRPARPFTATAASITLPVSGARLLMLPFSAVIPDGAVAYSFADDLTLVQMRSIPAHTPVLVEGNGELTFTGSGEVAYTTSPLDAVLRGTYCQQQLYSGDYTLGQRDGQWGLVRLTADATLLPFGVYAHPATTADFVPFMNPTFISSPQQDRSAEGSVIYNLMGQKVSGNAKGIVISGGKKLVKTHR